MLSDTVCFLCGWDCDCFVMFWPCNNNIVLNWNYAHCCVWMDMNDEAEGAVVVLTRRKMRLSKLGMESSVDMSTFGEGSLLRLRDVFVISGTQVRLTNHTQYWRKTFCKHFAGPKKVSPCLKVSKGERTERNNKKLYFLYLNMG